VFSFLLGQWKTVKITVYRSARNTEVGFVTAREQLTTVAITQSKNQKGVSINIELVSK